MSMDAKPPLRPFVMTFSGEHQERAERTPEFFARMFRFAEELRGMGLQVHAHKLATYDPGEEAIPEPPIADSWPKPTGGGWYELSNGKKVQGETKAHRTQAELSRRAH